MRKFLKIKAKMLSYLLIVVLTVTAVNPGFIQPSVVYAAEEPAAPQQGTKASPSIILGKGTIEINGHLFTDEEFQTFLSNAEINRVPFEKPSTFSLGDYGEIIGDDAQTVGGLVILTGSLIGVFQKLSVTFNLSDLANSAYNIIGVTNGVQLPLDVRFFPDKIEINGILINSYNKALVELTDFFVKRKKTYPNEQINNPGAATGETAKPGEDTGDASKPKPKTKKPVSGKTGKEAANDVPDWARGNRPYVDENGNDFATRLMDEKYGKGNYRKGPDSEYNKIKKWGDRGFE